MANHISDPIQESLNQHLIESLICFSLSCFFRVIWWTLNKIHSIAELNAELKLNN